MEPLPGTGQEAPGAEQLPPHLEASPVPGCVPVRWPLQVPELDLVGSVCAPDIHREFHLQELVSLLPLNLNVAAEGRHHGGTDRQRLHFLCPGVQQPVYASYNKNTPESMDEPPSTLVPRVPQPWAAFCRGGWAAADSREENRDGGYNSGTRFSSLTPSSTGG